MISWRSLFRLGRKPAAQPCGCPPEPGADPAFSAAVTALGAKLARADGRADPAEYDGFVEAFRPTASAMEDVGRLYRLARETTLGFESYARRLAQRYRDCPALLEDVLHGLFHVAKSDGVVSADELRFLDRVGELFGFTRQTIRRIRADHLGLAADDPYRVLEVAPDATDEAVRAAWRRAMSRHHPDRALGEGQSTELVEAAHARSSAINAAFEAVMRERRTGLVGAV